MSTLKAMFSGLPSEAFAGAMEKSQVSPAALGAGYLVFFLYSSLIGVVAVILAFMVARRQRRKDAET
jgi:PAT family beta-lactamase induction signal transducer AmpG